MNELYFIDSTRRRSIITVFPLTKLSLTNDYIINKCSIIVEKFETHKLIVSILRHYLNFLLEFL